MAVSNELTVQQREVIFEDMDQVTQEAATDGAKKLQAGFQVALLIQYDLGTIVNRIFEAEHLNETQQKQEVKKLAAYWNQDKLGPTTLYDLRNVASAFDREFIKEQVEERLTNGGYLTWSHFKELQKVSSEKRQLSILKQVRRHSWSANELALELQGKKESEVKRAGGRKPTLPKTPNAMLQKLFTSIQQSDNYVQAVNEPLEGIFLEMPASDVDDQFVSNIDNTLARMDEAQAHIKETEKKLKKVRTRVVNVLKKAEKAGAKEEASMALAAKESPDAGEGGGSVTGKKRAKKRVLKKTPQQRAAADKGPVLKKTPQQRAAAAKKSTSVTSAKKSSKSSKAPAATKKKTSKRGTPRRSSNAAPSEADAILAED